MRSEFWHLSILHFSKFAVGSLISRKEGEGKKRSTWRTRPPALITRWAGYLSSGPHAPVHMTGWSWVSPGEGMRRGFSVVVSAKHFAFLAAHVFMAQSVRWDL